MRKAPDTPENNTHRGQARSVSRAPTHGATTHSLSREHPTLAVARTRSTKRTTRTAARSDPRVALRPAAPPRATSLATSWLSIALSLLVSSVARERVWCVLVATAEVRRVFPLREQHASQPQQIWESHAESQHHHALTQPGDRRASRHTRSTSRTPTRCATTHSLDR
jgi:hypothetical protein